jgi:hypothetical protein
MKDTPTQRVTFNILSTPQSDDHHQHGTRQHQPLPPHLDHPWSQVEGTVDQTEWPSDLLKSKGTPSSNMTTV